MSLENLNENTKSIQVNNSLVYLKLKENSHSRALKTIPDENSNSFLVSTVSNNESEIVKITYKESNKQLTKTELIKFEQKEKKFLFECNNQLKLYFLLIEIQQKLFLINLLEIFSIYIRSFKSKLNDDL